MVRSAPEPRYQVIAWEDRLDSDDQRHISALIEEGWVPLGNVSVDFYEYRDPASAILEHGCAYAQALWKPPEQSDAPEDCDAAHLARVRADLVNFLTLCPLDDWIFREIQGVIARIDRAGGS